MRKYYLEKAKQAYDFKCVKNAFDLECPPKNRLIQNVHKIIMWKTNKHAFDSECVKTYFIQNVEKCF